MTLVEVVDGLFGPQKQVLANAIRAAAVNRDSVIKIVVGDMQDTALWETEFLGLVLRYIDAGSDAERENAMAEWARAHRYSVSEVHGVLYYLGLPHQEVSH